MKVEKGYTTFKLTEKEIDSLDLTMGVLGEIFNNMDDNDIISSNMFLDRADIEYMFDSLKSIRINILKTKTCLNSDIAGILTLR